MTESVNKVAEDCHTRLEEFDKRLASNEKRIDDLKWFTGGIMGLFTIVFGLVAFLGNTNFVAEKADIRQTIRDAQNELLGKPEPQPQVDIFTSDGKPLLNQEVRVTIDTANNRTKLVELHIIFKNSGDAGSGEMNLKVYAKGQLKLSNQSTDEPTYESEYFAKASSLDPNSIPAKLSYAVSLFVPLGTTEPPPPGSYSTLLKVYYGKSKVTQVPFVMVLPN